MDNSKYKIYIMLEKTNRWSFDSNCGNMNDVAKRVKRREDEGFRVKVVQDGKTSYKTREN